MEEKGSAIKVAVTVWEDRVSPVFDSARNLLIAEIENAQVTRTSYLRFDPEMVSQLARMLRAQGVDAIICGAVSEAPATLLEGAGFELIPFIASDVDRVLKNFIKAKPVWKELRMPGCGRNICCRGKIRKRLEMNNIAQESVVASRGMGMGGRDDTCHGNTFHRHKNTDTRRRFRK